MTRRAVMFIVVAVVVLLTTSVSMASTKTLRLLTYGNPDQKYFLDLIKEGFERDNPEYTLEFEIVAFGQYIERVLVNYAAGTAPDVFLTFAQYKPQFVEDGVILDLTDYIEKSDVMRLENFFPVIADNISYKGRYYGSPWGFNSTLWFVNVDLLNESGLAVPDIDWTVDDFREYARRVARPDDQIFGIASAPITNNLGIQWVENWAGHRWIDESGRHAMVNSEKTIEMIEFWRELVMDLRVVPSSLAPRAPGSSYLVTGDVAFQQLYSSEVMYQTAQLLKQGTKPVNWTLITYPKAPAGQKHFAQGHLWSIPSNHPNPDEAWRLVEWLGSEAADYIWASSQRTPPTMFKREHWDAYNRDLPPEYSNTALDFIINVLYTGEYAQNFEYWPTYDPMVAIWTPAVSSILTGQRPTRATMEDAARAMQAVLDEYWQR